MSTVPGYRLIPNSPNNNNSMVVSSDSSEKKAIDSSLNGKSLLMNPNWFNEMETSFKVCVRKLGAVSNFYFFKEVIIAPMSQCTRDALEDNIDISDIGVRRSVMLEILRGVVSYLKQIFRSDCPSIYLILKDFYLKFLFHRAETHETSCRNVSKRISCFVP